MKKAMLVAVIGITILALACNAADLSGPTGRSILLRTINATSNSTNSTLNSTNNSTLNSTATLGNGSDLWSWGNLPVGYARKGNQVVATPPTEANESVMQTPSQLVPGNNNMNSGGGLLVKPK
jgi:hypothetical protein